MTTWVRVRGRVRFRRARCSGDFSAWDGYVLAQAIHQNISSLL